LDQFAAGWKGRGWMPFSILRSRPATALSPLPTAQCQPPPAAQHLAQSHHQKLTEFMQSGQSGFASSGGVQTTRLQKIEASSQGVFFVPSH
jgi:hypothetical protein